MNFVQALEEFDAVYTAVSDYLNMNHRDAAGDLFISTAHCCIAGGFIRDRLLGREPKDIDIVVEQTYSGIDWVEQRGAKYDHGGVTYIGTLPETAGDLANLPLEFIIRNVSATPWAITEYHSCPLSNVFYDQQGLHVHPSFTQAVIDRVVGPSTQFAPTRCEREGEREHINKYLKRVHKKYPEFRLELL